MATRRNFLSAIGGTSVAAQAQAGGGSLRQELAAFGHALSVVTGSTIVIKPFEDQSELVRRFPLEPFGTGAAGEFVDCSWSPDGRAAALFRRYLGEPSSLLIVVDRKGARLWALPDPPRSSSGFALSPDCTRIAYQTANEEKVSLWHVNSDAKPIRVATAPLHGRSSWTYQFGWTPDGKANIVSWNRSIQLCDANGRLTELAAGLDPAVSPDGKYLSYCDQDGRLKVTLFSAPDGKPLCRTRRAAGPAEWSQDSRYVVFEESGWFYGNDVLVRRISDGATVKLWENGGRRLINVAWVPQWRELAQNLPNIRQESKPAARTIHEPKSGRFPPFFNHLVS